MGDTGFATISNGTWPLPPQVAEARFSQPDPGKRPGGVRWPRWLQRQWMWGEVGAALWEPVDLLPSSPSSAWHRGDLCWLRFPGIIYACQPAAERWTSAIRWPRRGYGCCHTGTHWFALISPVACPGAATTASGSLDATLQVSGLPRGRRGVNGREVGWGRGRLPIDFAYLLPSPQSSHS